jgi:hypothetical protein
MGREDLALLSAVLTACCVLPYLRDVHRHTTRPQRTSWLVFAALSIVAAVSQIVAGNSSAAWLAGGSALGFSVVFAVSIRHGEGGRSPRDLAALSIGLIGALLSIVVGRPLIAVVGVIIAEIAAISLTARKAVRDPASETASTWLLDCAAGALAIAAVAQFSLSDLLYPVHHTLVNAWVVVAIGRGRSAQLRHEFGR